MDPAVSVVLGLLGLLILGLAYCIAVTIGARHYPPRTVWAVWGVLLLGFVAVRAVAWLQDPFSRSLGAGYGIVFMFSLFGGPSAAATWMAVKRARRAPLATVVRDCALVIGAFLLVIPPLALLLALPDVVRLFR